MGRSGEGEEQKQKEKGEGVGRRGIHFFCPTATPSLTNEFCLCSTGEYYSLSCEPTLGECQIFHSMVKRQPIRTRDAIKLIGDGQEQKLKKDRVIESWIKVKLHTHHLGCHATSFSVRDHL